MTPANGTWFPGSEEGSTTSARATALVVLPVLAVATAVVAQPANDDCANAAVVSSLPFSDTGIDMAAATTEPGDPVSACLHAQGSNSVWYRIPAGSPKDLVRGLPGGTTTEFAVAVWSGSCGALTELNCFLIQPGGPKPDFGVAANGQEVLVEILNNGTAGTLDLDMDLFPEFLIDEGGVGWVHVGAGPNGFLVTYGGEGSLEGRLYDTNGNAISASFVIHSDFWIQHDVAGAGNGNFVVIDADSTGIEAVGVDGSGTVTEFPSVSVGDYPRVAADAVGNFVVVWNDTDGSFDGVMAQRFDQTGTPLGAAFAVNTYTTGIQEYPNVAMAATGEFVVVWNGFDADSGVAARLFDASGNPIGDQFMVNEVTTSGQALAAVGMDAAGNFVVAWDDSGDRYVPGEGTFYEPIMARRFDAAGSPRGGEFVVDTNSAYDGGSLSLHVAVGGGGDFMVVWEEDGFTVIDVHARRFGADGSPIGPEFFVNTFANGYSSYDPDVAATPAGDFIVAWDDFRGFFSDIAPGVFNEDGILGRHFPAPGIACASTPMAICRTPTVPLKAKLLLVDAPDALHDQLRWKFVKGAATDPADLGDPGTDEDYVLCMYGAAGPAGGLLMENRLLAGGACGTKPCWKALGNPPGSKGYRYKNKARTPHGILKMVVKPGVEGKSKVVIKGGQGSVFSGGPGVPPLPLPLPVTVQLQNRSGECWQATYDADGVGVNEAGFFKGSGS